MNLSLSKSAIECILFLTVTSFAANVQHGDVLINEFLPAPSSGDEWVELYNTTSSDLDIGGCYLDDIENGGKAPYQIPSGTIISAHGYYTHDFNSYLNNGGDDVRFIDEDGLTELDVKSYGSTGPDLAYFRLPDGGVWQHIQSDEPTKGSTNGISSIEPWTLGNLEIHHMNIGQGDATLVVGPTGKSLLIDAGESYWNSHIDADKMGAYIETVLGHKNLDYVLITHFHLDHIGYVGYGGLWHLVEEQGFTVGTMYHRDYNTYLGTSSGTFDEWKTYLEGSGVHKLNPKIVTEGSEQINLEGDVTVTIVAVDGNGAILPGDFSSDIEPPSENDFSVCAVIEWGLFEEFTGGDLSGIFASSQYGYAYHDIELSVAKEVGDVDVLRVNHHGSDHSSFPLFVNQLDPVVSIISLGDDNTYGHPAQDVIDLVNATSQCYLTERGDLSTDIGSAIVSGDIVIKTNDGINYSVNGTEYTASDPVRIDADGDGYFVEVDPDDGSSNSQPSANGGVDCDYQPCNSTFNVYDIDGAVVQRNKKYWKSSVTFRLQDNTGGVVANAKIRVRWTAPDTKPRIMRGTTDANGDATFTQCWGNRISRVRCTIKNATHELLTYESSDNFDTEGDSNGNRIIIKKSKTRKHKQHHN